LVGHSLGRGFIKTLVIIIRKELVIGYSNLVPKKLGWGLGGSQELPFGFISRKIRPGIV